MPKLVWRREAHLRRVHVAESNGSTVGEKPCAPPADVVRLAKVEVAGKLQDAIKERVNFVMPFAATGRRCGRGRAAPLPSDPLQLIHHEALIGCQAPCLEEPRRSVRRRFHGHHIQRRHENVRQPLYCAASSPRGNASRSTGSRGVAARIGQGHRPKAGQPAARGAAGSWPCEGAIKVAKGFRGGGQQAWQCNQERDVILRRRRRLSSSCSLLWRGCLWFSKFSV